jgi:hypothetical protein
MSTVGNLVASQIWQIDAGSALSASRQQFTRWVYQGFLPAVWDLWDMSYCNTDTGETTYGIQICFPPPQELGISYYSTGYYETSDGGNYAYTSFVGLLPRQTPCAQGPYGFYYCHFVSLQSHGYGPALTSLFTPVSTACSYNPSAGTAWTYDNCTLGVTYAEIGQPSIWNFANYTCEYNYPGDDVTFTTCAAIEPRMSLRKAEVGGDGTAELTLTMRLTQPLDVNRTTLTLHSFARETGDAEELFASATPFPRVLTPPATRHRSLSLVSRPGEVPRMSARLAIHGDVLVIQLLAESVGLANLPRCNGDDTLRTMFLTTQITVDDGIHRPQQGIVTAPWQCSSHAGRLRLSRPLALGP